MREVFRIIYNAFVPLERQSMRNALKFYVANGCISDSAMKMRKS